MSDMATIGWQRRPAREIGRFAGSSFARAACRAALRRPLRTTGALTLALLGLVAADFLTVERPPRVAPAPVPAPARPGAAPWLEVIKPLELYSLDAGDFSKSSRSYRARRHAEGGGRQDTITLGTPGTEPMLRLSLYRRGAEPYSRAPFFADVARQAAEAGLSVTRSALPDLLPTRFGAFEVAAVNLSAGDAPATPCSGYRLVLDDPALTVSGLACGGAAATNHDSLRCLLERLDLASGGSDRTLVEFFAASELKRSGTCAGARLAPDRVHAAWLDDRPATPRRNPRRR